MFESFEQMYYFYRRRNIFNQHDDAMLAQEIVHDNDTFLAKIVNPKLFQGRLNYGDFLRIIATIL